MSQRISKYAKTVNGEIYKFYLFIVIGKISTKGRCFSSLRRELLFTIATKPIVNSIIYRALSAVERTMSGRRLSPVTVQGER